MATASGISPELEQKIKQNTLYSDLPPSVKENLNEMSYDRLVVEYSLANQLLWRYNLVKHIIRNEKTYYEEVVQHCRNNLMLYPYHLQDQLAQGLKVTPFDYYCSMLEMIMSQQKSYDSLPNFTARDCYRLVGIGRNEYIDIMNKYRSKRFWKRRNLSEFLPNNPVESVPMQPWWIINVGFVTEEEVENCSEVEHQAIDSIINDGARPAGTLDQAIVKSLFTKKLVYLVIIISNKDYIVVPPLQGFVMNRVQGDYMETLLYKVFVTISEHTSVGDLASMLQINEQEVKNAVSVFIRLGFAFKKGTDDMTDYHPSWRTDPSPRGISQPRPAAQELEVELSGLVMENMSPVNPPSTSSENTSTSLSSFFPELSSSSVDTSGSFHQRIGFLFDSTLTAFLMMGNLSPGLKNHAVTMFEVGKLTDEVLDSFLAELDKVREVAEGEGEALRYFQHALTLKNTVQFLRKNEDLAFCGTEHLPCLDLLRCESMASLDQGTLTRLLQKNYCVLISMAPLSQEVKSVSSCYPPHIGPAISEMNSIWFRLWLYHRLQTGPTSLLLTRGSRLSTLPLMFKNYRKLLLTSWGHDTAVMSTSNVLITVNEALTHSPVLIQGYGWRNEGTVKQVVFPFDRTDLAVDHLNNHPALQKLQEITDLSHTCGYVTMLNSGAPVSSMYIDKVTNGHTAVSGSEISDFLDDLQELGIGEGDNMPRRVNHVDQKPTATQGQSVPSTPTLLKSKLSQEWVPLELCFGIPLFSDEANKHVCEKIVKYGLLREENLQQMVQTSRVLALELMNFISSLHDEPIYDTTHNDSKKSHTIPLPTRSLIFQNGKLGYFS